MYENKTEDVIRQEMLDQVTSNVSKDEGTIIYDALSPVANEIAKTYIDLDSILIKAFAQDSYGTWLDKRASEFGVIRKPGVAASGIVKFTGASGTVISKGFLITTADQLTYATVADITIAAGIATATVQATATGLLYNVGIGSINQIVVAQAGVNAVTNITATTGGAEIEEDESLRERLLLKVQTPATSGNAYHYKQWALEVAGVGAAKIFPIWNGPGTVKVCIVDTNMQPANETIINAAKTHIEEERPIGATVTVSSATMAPVAFTISIKRDGTLSLDEIKTSINESLTKYLKDIAFVSDYVSINKVVSLMMDEKGISDVTNLLINNGNTSVTIGSEQIAVVGTVTVNEQI